MKSISLYLFILISGATIIYLLFFTSPAPKDAEFTRQQKAIENRIDSLSLVLDSLKTVAGEIKESQVIIYKLEDKQKNEVAATNNLDTLIILFNRYMSSPGYRQ